MADPVNAGAAILLAALLVPAFVAVRDEVRVRDAGTAALRAADGATPRPPEHPAPPRAALLWALSEARIGARLPPGTVRAYHLDRASDFAGVAAAARPAWGQAEVTRAYIGSLAGPDALPAAISAYAASYREAPFLEDVADWRIAWGLAHWALLDPATRKRLIAEAAWRSTDADGYIPTTTAMVGHPAEVPFYRARAALVRAAPPQPDDADGN